MAKYKNQIDDRHSTQQMQRLPHAHDNNYATSSRLKIHRPPDHTVPLKVLPLLCHYYTDPYALQIVASRFGSQRDITQAM